MKIIIRERKYQHGFSKHAFNNSECNQQARYPSLLYNALHVKRAHVRVCVGTNARVYIFIIHICAYDYVHH